MTESIVFSNPAQVLETMKSMQEEVQELRDDCKDAQKEAREWEDKYTDMETEAKEWKRKYHMQVLDTSGWKKRSEILEAGKKKAETDCQDLVKTNTVMKENISKSSSEISTLQNELLKKTETITSLNGRIANLSDSDLILRRNKELETENRNLKDRISRTESAADDRIALIQKECRQTSDAVDEYKQILDKREADLRKKEEDIEGFIFQKASEKAAEAKRVLEAGYEQKKNEVVRDFEIKKTALIGFFIFSSLYGILITLLQLGRSKRFTGDMVGAGGAAFGAIKWYVLLIWDWSGGVGKWVFRTIENPIWHKVLSVTVITLLLVIFIGGIAFGVGYGLYKLAPFLYRKFGDVMTLSYFLVSLSVIAWIVDICDKYIPINTVLIYMVCLIGYFGIRWFISRKNIGNLFRRGYRDGW